MTANHLRLLSCTLLLAVFSARAQTINGSTTLDIDPATDIVTVACETDLDIDSEAYYEAQVGCTLTDGNGTLLASGNTVDDSDEGFAQVILSYQGTPGNIYKATGEHSGVIIFATDNVDQGWEGGGNEGFGGQGFDDVYNFAAVTEFIDMGYGTIPFDFSYYGPGPLTETKKKTLPVIYTTDIDGIPASAATLTMKFSGPIDSDDGASFKYNSLIGSTNLGPIVGRWTTGAQVCQIGNEATGTITAGNIQSVYTVKRTLMQQFCYTGANGDVLASCGGGTAPGADDTGTWITNTPFNSKVFNLDIPGLSSLTSTINLTRVRAQFAVYVVDSSGSQISPTVRYYSNVSCEYPFGQSSPALSTDVFGDNQGGIGKTLFSWNLK